MTKAATFLKNLVNLDQDFIGTVTPITDRHWHCSSDTLLPIQIETLAQSDRFILYGTGIRKTGEPVLTSILNTQFLENLTGHSLGNYGICAGPVTLTIYQIITIRPCYSLDRLAAEIACHRMLVECFLESNFDPEDSWPKTMKDLEDISPLLPFHH